MALDFGITHSVVDNFEKREKKVILDDLIERLEEIKAADGWGIPVYVEYDCVYEQIRDTDEISFGHPAGQEIDAGWDYGVLIG